MNVVRNVVNAFTNHRTVSFCVCFCCQNVHCEFFVQIIAKCCENVVNVVDVVKMS